MIKPHGEKLIKRIASEKDKESLLSKKGFEYEISKELAQEVKNIANGLFSPLEGFLTEKQLISVADNMRLPDGNAWTIPILLDISEDNKNNIKDDFIFLSFNGEKIAYLEIEDIYKIPKQDTAKKVYTTEDINHPGVKRIMELKDFAIGGKLTLLNSPHSPYSDYDLTPEQTRAEFEKRGWEKIVGFQTRNVPHLGHEFVQKAALTVVDGLFINPIIGKKKKGDFKDEVILKSYKALIDNYFPENRVFLSILPTEMRYGGPREAIHHAIIRKNFGCTHFIVGRDHAGVGDYYHPYAAHEIFKKFPELEIEPVIFRAFFYCKKCRAIASDKTCPHGPESHINFAGKVMRKMITEGTQPPEDQMRPEVSKVIISYKNPFVD